MYVFLNKQQQSLWDFKSLTEANATVVWAHVFGKSWMIVFVYEYVFKAAEKEF